MCRKFFQKFVSHFFKSPSQNFFEDFQIFFPAFFKCYSGFYNLYISANFLPCSPKTIAKFFHITNFHQKPRNANFCAPMFFHNLFKVSSQLIIIRSYIVMFAKTLQENWTFSRNYIKIFQQLTN